MSAPHILVFPIIRQEQTIRLPEAISPYRDEITMFSAKPTLDWTSRDPNVLTQNLRRQVDHEALKLVEYARMICGGRPPRPDLIRQEYGVSQEEFEKACKDLAAKGQDYRDLMAMYDEKAFLLGYDHPVGGEWQFIDLDSQLYAVVLIYRGEYYGHIYSFISPTEPEYGFAVGIRSRVDIRFLGEETLYNIPYYLLEGVRRFLVHSGSRYLVIPDPVERMAQFLTRLGFQLREDRDLEKFGNSIVAHHTNRVYMNMCECYYSPSLTEPWTPDVQVELVL